MTRSATSGPSIPTCATCSTHGSRCTAACTRTGAVGWGWDEMERPLERDLEDGGLLGCLASGARGLDAEGEESGYVCALPLRAGWVAGAGGW